MKHKIKDLKTGDLVAIAFGNTFIPGMFLCISDTLKFRALSYYNNPIEKWIDQMIAGEKSLPSIDYITVWNNRRIIKISEDILDSVEKKYLDFYRQTLPNEYKNNRPGNTF